MEVKADLPILLNLYKSLFQWLTKKKLRLKKIEILKTFKNIFNEFIKILFVNISINFIICMS